MADTTEQKKTYSLKNLTEAMVNNLSSVPLAKINLHNKKSLDRNTIFSRMSMPLDKAYQVFGDREIIYPQLGTHVEYYKDGAEQSTVCIRFGIVIEDENNDK